jgi:NIPSNAP.
MAAGTTATSCRPRARSDKALALFSFPSLAAYEQYRGLFGEHPDFVAADRIRDESGCVLRYERTFMRPLLPGD